jgi:adenine-specific DNA-methyltransferase
MPSLNWIGKEAVEHHHKEVAYRLVHCDGALSAGDPDAGNLLVQGDNLEALKALLPYYGGQVKCIYIDPPYNTGQEQWIYNDNVKSPTIQAWLGKVVGAEEKDLSRHDKWLCMMYPRLRLLRDFLRRDGVIFVSIDDNEVAHLRLLLDEIFGRQNFVAEMIWEGAFKNDARQIGVNHEYILVYARERTNLPREWALPKEGVEPVLAEVKRLKKLYGDDYDSASRDLAGWFRAKKATPSFGHRRFRYIDSRGAYKEDDPTAPGGRRFELKNPLTGETIPLRPNRGWAFDQDAFNALVKDGRISFITSTSIMVRRYLHETDYTTPQSVFYQPTRSGSERLEGILGKGAFDFPKDEVVLEDLIQMATDDNSIILDSFAGSGTTGHAVLNLNKETQGNRRFILIEMEERIAQKTTARRLEAVINGYDKKDDPEKRVEGLGGGFRYCRLGVPLFNEFGDIDGEVSFPDLAAHVFFAETGAPIPAKAQVGNAYLGKHGEKAVYLLYTQGLEGTPREALGNVLTPDALVALPPTPEGFEGVRVVYAEGTTVSPDRLKAEGVVFKQIPYQIAGV